MSTVEAWLCAYLTWERYARHLYEKERELPEYIDLGGEA